MSSVPGPDERVVCYAMDVVKQMPDIVGVTHLVKIVGGRSLYQRASPAVNHQVLLERKGGNGQIIKRYVRGDEGVVLIPLATAHQERQKT